MVKPKWTRQRRPSPRVLRRLLLTPYNKATPTTDDPLQGRATGNSVAPLAGRAWDDKFNGLSGVGQTDNSQAKLPAGLSNDNTFKLRVQDARVLSRFNIQLLVDRSNSMRAWDCPYNLSRWQWCGLQATSLASALDPLVTNGLTITTFATQFDVFDNADARSIQYIFQNVQTQSGTRLYEPLAEQADRYFSDNSPAKKPLLIVVVTDGIPAPRWEPVRVRDELVAISKRVKNASDATVIFCQVGGNDRMGRAYLQDLDQNLMAYGAKYNMVHMVGFEELMKTGLGGALSAAIQKYAPPPAVAQGDDLAKTTHKKRGGK